MVLPPRPLALAFVLLLATGAGCVGTRAPAERATLPPLAIAVGSQVPPEEAERTLREAVAEAGLTPPELLDQYLTQVAVNEVDPSLLWAAYRHVLAQAGEEQSETARAHLARHLALSELLYPDPFDAEGTLGVRADRALKWWVAQHGAPAGGTHERLTEHLRRVARAWEKYPAAHAATGVDARGETLVRYGPPSRTRQVAFDDPHLLRYYLDEGLSVRYTDFPNNEVWLYDELGEGALFLFVEGRRGGGYRLGAVNDLLPRQLRTRGVSGSARGNTFAIASLQTLQLIFSQLALFHPAYSARYDAIASYANWHEEFARGQRAGRRQTVPAGFDGVSRTLENALARNERDDRRIGERRDTELPAETARTDQAQMPVAWRVARRLSPEGAPVASVYWRVLPEGATICARHVSADPSEGHRVRFVAYASDLGTEETVLDTVYGQEPWDRVHHHALPLAKPAGALALQVDAWEGHFLGACSAVARAGPVEPLAFNASGFAVSDFVPFEVRDLVEMQERMSSADFSAASLPAFLGPSLAGLAGLGVYFEVYAQTDLEDAYVLEYEVRERTRGGLFRRGQTRSSVFQGRRAVVDQRLPAAFLIDRSEWDGADEVEIVLTVTNLETGEAEERRMTIPTGAASQ